MPGDEVHEEAGAAAYAAPAAGVGREPRHAAPRKPLLTRLHVPAGKAIAMAAMPTAVLMGMGLTPQLAQAKPLPKNPLKSGACVTQEDRAQEAEEAEKEAEAEKKAETKAEQEKAEQRKAAEEKAEQEKAADDKAADEKDGKAGSGSSDSGSGSGTDDSGSDAGSGSGDTSGDEGGSGSDGEDSNPLDPLGLGEKIKDIFTPDEEKAQTEAAQQEDGGKQAEASPSPDASPSTDASASGSGDDAGSDAESGAGDAVEDTVGKVGDGIEDTTDTVEETAEGAKKGVEDAAGGGDVTFPTTEQEAQDAADGTSEIPCVEEKKSEGDDERTPATVPNDPWELQASSLGLHGLDYKGVVNIQTADGGTKQALKFTADSVDIGDLHQIVEGPGGATYHVKGAKGSTSTIRGGQVTMYTERLEGNLFGLIPIVFDPEHPPPLNIPEAYFTHVKVTQAGQFGGNLTIPGLDQYVD